MESSLRLGERFPGVSSLGEVTTLVLEFSAGELTWLASGDGSLQALTLRFGPCGYAGIGVNARGIIRLV
jgi:hypothetical protein